MMRIMLLGAPGSGKGTQAQRLQAKYGVPQVSSGDLLRDAVARGTELGMKAKAVMESGQLVSDDIVLGLIRERLGWQDAADGFILDGFPRNIDQANALDVLLGELKQPLDAVLLLEVRRETLVQRLAGRRVCSKCGTVYNIHSMAPGATGCSKDGAELYQRPDDREDVVGKRLEVYEQQTRPLIEHYGNLGLLRVVAGEGELDEVFERMESAALTKPLAAGKVKVKRQPAAKAAASSAPVAAKKAGAGQVRRKQPARKQPAKKQPAKKQPVKKPAAKAERRAKTAAKRRGPVKSAKKSIKKKPVKRAKSVRKAASKRAKQARKK